LSLKAVAFFLILIGVAALLISSPEHRVSGGRLSPVAVASIRNGKTTRFQVRALLGAPRYAERQQPIRQIAGADPLPAKFTATEIWTYMSTNPKGANSSDYQVVVYFDERGTVLDCEAGKLGL